MGSRRLNVVEVKGRRRLRFRISISRYAVRNTRLIFPWPSPIDHRAPHPHRHAHRASRLHLLLGPTDCRKQRSHDTHTTIFEIFLHRATHQDPGDATTITVTSRLLEHETHRISFQLISCNHAFAVAKRVGRPSQELV